MVQRLLISLGLVPLVMVTGCTKESDSEDIHLMQSQEILSLDGIDSMNTYSLSIRQELKETFCIHAFRLPLKSDFTDELNVLCTDNLPNRTFDDLDRFSEFVGDMPRSLRLNVEHEGNRSTGLFATVYELPIQPKWVRSADIGSFMVKDSSYDYVQQIGAASNLDNTVGGDLQFGKSSLEYKTTVQTSDGQTFNNHRLTELNSFQVQGGNSDIGLGAEHLVESENNDYVKYNTITVTIGTETDGSVLITIINLDVDNNGFPELTEQVMSDIATAQASHVRMNLWSNLQDHVIE